VALNSRSNALHIICLFLISYVLGKLIWSFEKFSPCWWAHIFPHRDLSFHFVQAFENDVNAVYHPLALRVRCKIPIQAAQTLVQSNKHNSCQNMQKCTVQFQVNLMFGMKYMSDNFNCAVRWCLLSFLPQAEMCSFEIYHCEWHVSLWIIWDNTRNYSTMLSLSSTSYTDIYKIYKILIIGLIRVLWYFSPLWNI
jgi:hypothetical protein